MPVVMWGVGGYDLLKWRQLPRRNEREKEWRSAIEAKVKKHEHSKKSVEISYVQVNFRKAGEISYTQVNSRKAVEISFPQVDSLTAACRRTEGLYLETKDP